MKTRVQSILLVITLLFLGLLQLQAVSPAPDGCYPNYTTAEGCNALNFLTSGAGNTGIGWYSLYSNSTGNFNTGLGGGALALNNADSNTAVGAAALLLNTTGTLNTAVGTDALLYNDAAEQNTATGALALFSHVSGNGNTANGARALYSDISGQLNTAIGAGALFSNVGGPFPGSFNTAVGATALYNSTGGDNTAVGAGALQGNTTGAENLAIGVSALVSNQSGDRNIALGSFAGNGLTTGSDNIYIGYNLGATPDQNNACYIKSIFGQTAAGGSAVYIDANHKLGTMTSSKRFKEDIKPMDKLSEALFALKPVSFRYKKQVDPAATSQLGLVAEDVEKVNPDLVVRDKEGKPYSVRYDQVNAMLLNEFLKEHQKVQKQGATIEELTAEIRNLTATVKEQAAQIQNVRAQIALSKPAQQVVRNP
ncbi:MAG: tail fiber domain-containing protein [Alphaproteobacteria bacterium]